MTRGWLSKGFPLRDLWLQHVPAGDRLPHARHHGGELSNGRGMVRVGPQIHESQGETGRKFLSVRETGSPSGDEWAVVNISLRMKQPLSCCYRSFSTIQNASSRRTVAKATDPHRSHGQQIDRQLVHRSNINQPRTRGGFTTRLTLKIINSLKVVRTQPRVGDSSGFMLQT